MKYFSRQDIDNIASMKDIIDSIDDTYSLYHQGDFHMPTRTQVTNNQNTLVLMPCFTDKYISTKLITVFPENTKQNLSTINGTVTLNCNKSGVNRAILDGTYLTGIRTGAIGGNAVRHLAKRDVETLAVIGTGVQGFYQTLAACEERKFKQINVYNRTKGEKVTNFVHDLETALDYNAKVSAKNSPSEAIEEADVVITATSSQDPVLPDDQELLKNKLIIGIGSFQPDMREFPDSLYDVISNVFIDSWDAKQESGDLITPIEKGWLSSDDVHTMASFIDSPIIDIESNDETILFKSTGMALFDSVVASNIYEASI